MLIKVYSILIYPKQNRFWQLLFTWHILNTPFCKLCAVLSKVADAKRQWASSACTAGTMGSTSASGITSWPLRPASTDKVSYFSLHLYLPSCNWQGKLFLSKSLSALLQLKRWASFHFISICLPAIDKVSYFSLPPNVNIPFDPFLSTSLSL